MPPESIEALQTLDLVDVDPNELVRRHQAGCPQSATALANYFTPRLLVLLERRLPGKHADAEDIAQDALTRAFANLHRFDAQYRFSTWLYTIAIRLATDFVRKENRRPRIESLSTLETFSPALDNSSNTASSAWEDVWGRARLILTEAQYTVLWLKYGEGQSIQEIAKILRKTQIGVRVQLHRARSKLSQELGRMESDPTFRPKCDPLKS